MKKLSVLLLVVIFCSRVVKAQQSDTPRLFEFEIGAGFNFADANLYGKQGMGLHLTFEARFNLPTLPIDVGVQLGVANYFRESGNQFKILYKTIRLNTVADYNFRVGQNVNPFVGCGIGLCTVDEDWDWDDGVNKIDDLYTDPSFVFMPRVGV